MSPVTEAQVRTHQRIVSSSPRHAPWRFPRPASVAFSHAAVAAVAAMFFVRGRDAGAWAGIAMVVGAPNLHGHGMLFLLPTLSPLRRDLALLLAASNRYPALR